MKRQARMVASAAAFACLLSAWSSTYAEGSYTVYKANGYVTAHDWDGLLRYPIEWTMAEPNAPMAWFYLGTTYGQALKQPSRALPAFEGAVALQPKWPEAWNALGLVNVDLKRYDEAIKAFTHAIDQSPTHANHWNSLAAVYSHQNRPSLATKALRDEQHAIAGSSVFADWCNLGNGFCAMQEYTLAAPAYRRAIQLKVDYGPAWNNVGTIEGVAGNTQAALNDYQRASALGDELGATNYAASAGDSRSQATQQRRSAPGVMAIASGRSAISGSTGLAGSTRPGSELIRRHVSCSGA